MIPCSVPGLEPPVRSEAEAAEGVFLSGEEGEESLGLTNDSLSRLRSPSVMEIREKANERLKEELAKAQRVRDHTHTHTVPMSCVCPLWLCVSTSWTVSHQLITEWNPCRMNVWFSSSHQSSHVEFRGRGPTCYLLLCSLKLHHKPLANVYF